MRNEPKYNDILDFISTYGAITNEICTNLFYNTKYGKDCSRRALNKLHDKKIIRKGIDVINNTYQYYLTRTISNHKLQLLRFYSYVVKAGAEILDFQKEYKSIKAISDGFMMYRYNGKTKIIVIETDITKKTKVKKYENLYEEGYFQEKYGTFPRVFILDANPSLRKRRMKSDKVKFEFLNFAFDGIESIL